MIVTEVGYVMSMKCATRLRSISEFGSYSIVEHGTVTGELKFTIRTRTPKRTAAAL